MSNRSRIAGINQSPNGHTDDLVNRIINQAPQLPSLTPDQLIPFLMSQGLPVKYGVGPTGNPDVPVQVFLACGQIGIPCSLDVAAARKLAAAIIAKCDEAEAAIELPHPVPAEAVTDMPE